MAQSQAMDNEIDAGEQFASYFEKAGNLDVFDERPSESSEREARKGDAARGKGVAPEPEGHPEGASRSEDSDEDEAAREAAKKADAEAEDSEDDEEGVEADAETSTIEHAALAKVFGVEEDNIIVDGDGAVRIRTKVDGVEGAATLGELVKGYQLEANANRKSEQLSNERRQLREAIAAREQQLAAAIEQAGAFGQVMQDRILTKYKGVNWDQLRAEDPGEYGALQQDLQREMQEVQYEVQRLQQTAQQSLQQAQYERQQQHQQWLAQQQQALFQHLPKLADPEKRQPVLQEYDGYLREIGFAPEEVQAIQDHRLMRVIDDAVAGARSRKSAKVGDVPLSKKLATVPKVLKAAAPVNPKEKAGTVRKKSLDRLRRSGSEDDAARFAIESGIVNNML